MKPLIKTENLSVIYNLGKSSEVPALLDVNLEIFPGEYVILFGPSGCGKSTLLNCLAGLETPTRGRIFIKEKEITQFSPSQLVAHRRLNVGIIFQAYNLIHTLNVLDNVCLPHILGRDIPGITQAKAKNLLKRFGILNLQHRYPSELSGGQQQRVAIARALMYHPPVLLADEPVGNLDSESAKVVMELLGELNEKEKETIILVTHDAHYLQSAHRVFHMRDGRIIRVVINPWKKQISPVKEEMTIPADIQSLIRLHPYLTESQLKAKILSQYLVSSFTVPETERLEQILEKRISGEISDKKLRELLDLPFERGGLGLYRQTATQFVREIENILSQKELLKRKFIGPLPPQKTALDIKVEEIRKFLLDQYSGTLKKEVELERLDKFIKQRIQGKISRSQFQRSLDLPLKEGGVGLYKGTARDFARKLELIISTS